MKESQLNLLEHSEIKLKLLDLYLEQYFNILNQNKYITNVKVFDVFCGEGVYENGGKGSPIIILEKINNMYRSKTLEETNKPNFECFFNDKDENKVKNLEKEVSKLKFNNPSKLRIEYSTKDYRDFVKTVAQEASTKKTKSFIFIDPYGYSDIRIKDIESLLSSKNSEVLLFLPTQFMFRFEKKGTPESLKVFIEELIGEDEWPNTKTGIDFIENLTKAFRKYFSKKHFVDSFIITRDKNQFFCLFFFTSHIYGFDRMLRAKWKLDEEEGRGWKYSSGNTLFSLMGEQPKIKIFEKELFEFIKKERTNGELYEFTIQNGHITSHTVQILTELLQNNRVELKLKNGIKATQPNFYINYQEYRDNNDRITVKIN